MGLFDFFKNKTKVTQKVAPKFQELEEGVYTEVSTTQFFQELEKYIDVSKWFGEVPVLQDSERCFIHLGDIKAKDFRFAEKLLVIGSVDAKWVNLDPYAWLFVTKDVECRYYTSNDNRIDFIQGNLTVDKILDTAFCDNYIGVKGTLKAEYLFGEDIPVEVEGDINVAKAEGYILSPNTKAQTDIPQVPVHEYLEIPKNKEDRAMPREYPHAQIYQWDAYANPAFQNQKFWDIYFCIAQEEQRINDMSIEQLNSIHDPLGTHFYLVNNDYEGTTIDVRFKINANFQLILDLDSLGDHRFTLFDTNYNYQYELTQTFLRFDELLLLCIRIRENDPRWGQGDIPFLLLQQLVIFGKNDEEAFDALAEQHRLILQKIGIHKVYPYATLDTKNAWVQKKGQWFFENAEITNRTVDKTADFPHDKWQTLMERIQSS